MRRRTCRARSSRGRCREHDTGTPRARRALEGLALVLVRFLLFLALATIGVALGFYVFKRDRRYLRFIAQVVKYTVFLMLGVLLFYAFERLVATA
jgi:energy-converting hydrogenase Eha subunit E